MALANATAEIALIPESANRLSPRGVISDRFSDKFAQVLTSRAPKDRLREQGDLLFERNCPGHDTLEIQLNENPAALQTKASYSSPVRNFARPLPKPQSASEDKLRDLPLAGDGEEVTGDMIEIVHGYIKARRFCR